MEVFLFALLGKWLTKWQATSTIGTPCNVTFLVSFTALAVLVSAQPEETNVNIGPFPL